MKKTFRAVLAMLIIFIGLTPVTMAVEDVDRTCKSVFSDSSTAESLCPYIEYLYHQDVIGGFSDGGFHPDEYVTRGQFAKMVVNAFGLQGNGSGMADFPDVQSSNTFYSFINVLHELEIINGYSDGTYRSDEFVSRGAAMKFIVNAAKSKSTALFPDNAGEISSIFGDVPLDYTFAEYISSAYGVNDPVLVETIIGGYSDGTFRPSQNMTRAQISKVLTNSIKYGGFERINCTSYFCQERHTSTSGGGGSSSGGGSNDGGSAATLSTIDGNYFSAKYDSSFWNKAITDSAGIFGELAGEEADSTQIANIGSDTSGYSSVILIALDLSVGEGVNFENLMAIIAATEGKTVNEFFGEGMIEELESDPSMIQSGGFSATSPYTSASGLYGIKVTLTDMVEEGITYNTSGYMEFGIKGNVMIINVALTDNDANLSKLQTILSTVTYK